MKNKWQSLTITLSLHAASIFAHAVTLPEHEIHANHVISSFAKKMNQDLGLVRIGSGGRMPHDIETIDMMFIAYEWANIDEARNLEVNITENLIEFINNNSEIRPYLRDYPMNSSHVLVSISFYTNEDTHYKDGSIAYVTQAKNTIAYFTAHPLTEKIAILKKESYQEAAKIVHAQHVGTAKNINQPSHP